MASPSLDTLKSKIAKAQQQEQSESADHGDAHGLGLSWAMKVISELIAGVIVGLLIGFFLDKCLDTTPLFILICLLLGLGGSMMNIYRLVTAPKSVHKDAENNSTN